MSEQPERKEGHSRLVYDKETRTINKEQPDVWESWLQRIPDQYDFPYWTDWAKAVQQWFMEIPCRRKP